MKGKTIVLLLFYLTYTHPQLYTGPKNRIRSMCPHLYQKTFRGYIPRGNFSAGIYTPIKDTDKLVNCVLKCCASDKCNIAFTTKDKCYHVECASNELCIPTLAPNLENRDDIAMVLVQPTVGEDSWEEVLSQQEFSGESLGREMYNFLSDPQKLEEAYKDLLMDGSTYTVSTACNVGIDDSCSENEVCEQNVPKSRAGTCKCKQGYTRNVNNVCAIPFDLTEETLGIMPEGFTDKIIPLTRVNATTAETKKQLFITVKSKEVRLPENEVTLMANVTPEDEPDKNQFEWISLTQPESSTAVKQQNGGELQLTKLSEGLYTFKVSVSRPDAYGEAFVNVTVLPPSRINSPPQIVISPANQTVKLPNTDAVLDASSSTDDNGIVSYHWELQQGPLGYEPQIQDSPTLQLHDLSRPGNYTFKLTVTDTDKATSVAIANITVLKITDYPPEANAGPDKIIHLPHNNITLNGNLSIDDHAITTWEWTKSPDDADKAVDMQDTRTPYLRLSNLEEGMYTFALKVTDSANQSSTAEVLVFVKPPTNQPPVAKGNGNLTMSLPQTWVVLDASGSTDDNMIDGYKWEQMEGPSIASILSPNTSVTNVTGLTKGDYQFKVTVTDDSGNQASDTVYVTVTQNKNQKPTANGGGNFEVELPCTAVILNGSKSTDDWAITRWKWTRDDSSLAVGNVVEKTDASPVLIITDVSVGKYVFNLTVYDEQGLSDTDTVTFVVRNDPKLYYLVDIVIAADVKFLTELQYETIKAKLALLVRDGMELQIRNVRPDLGTENALISFYMETSEGEPVPANEVVYVLREKLRLDVSLLGFSVVTLKTAVCQNNCSGHGVCDERTRECMCEAFWMKDMFRVYLSEGDSNCSWNILYVVLGIVCGLVLCVGCIWGLLCFCMNWCTKRRTIAKPTTYKLIEDTEDLPPYAMRKGGISDSDTDSEVMFETRTKSAPRFGGEVRNGHKANRNGFTKFSRRVKS